MDLYVLQIKQVELGGFRPVPVMIPAACAIPQGAYIPAALHAPVFPPTIGVYSRPPLPSQPSSSSPPTSSSVGSAPSPSIPAAKRSPPINSTTHYGVNSTSTSTSTSTSISNSTPSSNPNPNPNPSSQQQPLVSGTPTPTPNLRAPMTGGGEGNHVDLGKSRITEDIERKTFVVLQENDNILRSMSDNIGMGTFFENYSLMCKFYNNTSHLQDVL